MEFIPLTEEELDSIPKKMRPRIVELVKYLGDVLESRNKTMQDLVASISNHTESIKEINFLLHLLADIEDVYTKRLLLVPKGIRILRRGIREHLNLYHKKPQDS